MSKKITRFNLFKQRFKILFCKHHFLPGKFYFIDNELFEECEITGIICKKCGMFNSPDQYNN